VRRVAEVVRQWCEMPWWPLRVLVAVALAAWLVLGGIATALVWDALGLYGWQDLAVPVVWRVPDPPEIRP